MIITEIKGKSQVFTLKDGSTLRLLAREEKKISEELISEELLIAESMQLVLMTKDSVAEVPKNKKSGGTK